MKFSATKLISLLFSIFFIILFFYLFYRYFQLSKNFFSIYTSYLFICFLLIVFWLINFKSKNKTFRILSVIYFISILMPLYSYETYENYPQLSYIFDEFDLRTKKQVYKSVSNSKEVVPTVPLQKTEYKLFPLAGISKKNTLFCNETGNYIFYQSDRYGFRNEDKNWDKKIDAVLLGDSFAHGACVNKGISENLNKKINLINLGYQGNGPLKMYASLKEYGENLNPKYIIWMYDSNNDLDDLITENNNEVLKKYYFLDFKQNLVKKQNEIDENLNKIVIKKFNEDSNRKFSHTLKLYKTRQSIKNLFTKQNVNFDSEFTQFKNTINLSNNINSEIIFVFFSDSGTLKNEIGNVDKKIINYIKSKNIKIVNIHEIMKKEKNFLKYFPFNGKRFGHFNENGYKLVASKIEKLITK